MATANPATLVVRIEDPIDMTVADGSSFAKGVVLSLADPLTVNENTANGGKVAGIAAREKVASDGRTRMAVYMRGIFEMVCSGAVNIGDPLTCYASDVQVAPVTASGANIIGFALEAGADNETINVYVNVGAGAGAIS